MSANMMSMALAATLASCAVTDRPTQVNRPLAQERVLRAISYKEIRILIDSFSKQNNFAVQEILTEPRGNAEFSIRFFREDVTITINKIKGEPIEISGFPLCTCEAKHRLGLQAAADIAVKELAEILSR